MKQFITTLLVIIIFSATNIAYATPALEAYGMLEQVSDMSISPNGELIAYRHTESDDKDFIVVISLKDKKRIAALNVKKINSRGHYFANNDYLVIVGSQRLRLANYKDEVDVSTAFSFDL